MYPGFVSWCRIKSPLVAELGIWWLFGIKLGISQHILAGWDLHSKYPVIVGCYLPLSECLKQAALSRAMTKSRTRIACVATVIGEGDGGRG